MSSQSAGRVISLASGLFALLVTAIFALTGLDASAKNAAIAAAIAFLAVYGFAHFIVGVIQGYGTKGK